MNWRAEGNEENVEGMIFSLQKQINSVAVVESILAPEKKIIICNQEMLCCIKKAL